ncbi:MAG: hypothetical protein AAFR16_08345 [Pseudomonadota bacterium]
MSGGAETTEARGAGAAARPPANDHPAPSRKIRVLALIAPALGLLLLTPAAIEIVAAARLSAEAYPLGPFRLIAYVFGIWALLIVAAALLARPLLGERPDVGERSARP